MPPGRATFGGYSGPMIVGPLFSLALTLATFPTQLALDNPVIIQLHSLAGGVGGSASLFGTGGSVIVEVELQNEHENGEGVAIVDGDCAHIGRGAFALTSTVAGQSTTRIPNVSLQQVAGHRRALIVRRNENPSAPTLACGNISS